MKHTPGPWEHLFHSERIVGKNDEVVVYETNSNGDDISLICAAPKMYDYLVLLASSGDQQAKRIIEEIG